MTDPILVTTEAGVRTIRFNRVDKKNAITSDMYATMADALDEGEADPAVRVFLFLGRPGVFSAGNDIGDFIARATDGGLGEPVLRFLRGLARAQKPIVAGVDGLAIGVGTTMLMHCDLVYASPATVVKTPFLDLGLVPEAASSLIAPRLMGQARAFELLVLGTAFDAERAREAGIVNAVIASEALEQTATDAARAVAAKPPEALRIARRLLRGDPEEIIARIEEEAVAFRDRLASKEAQSAFMAFMMKSKT